MMLGENNFRQMCVCVPNSSTMKIKLEFMYICGNGDDFTPVSTTFPSDTGVLYLVSPFLTIKPGTLEDLL